MLRTLLAVTAVAFVALASAGTVWAQVPGYIVTGGGTFLSGGAPRFFGVDAADLGASDSGTFQMSGQTPAGLTFAFNVDVTCVNVVGSVAYLGGTARTGTGSDGADATGKVLRARLDDGSPDRAKVSLLPVGTGIPADCFASDPAVAAPGTAVRGQVHIRALP